MEYDKEIKHRFEDFKTDIKMLVVLVDYYTHFVDLHSIFKDNDLILEILNLNVISPIDGPFDKLHLFLHSSLVFKMEHKFEYSKIIEFFERQNVDQFDFEKELDLRYCNVYPFDI